MNTKATLLLATILAAGTAAAHPGAQQVNPRNPTDSRAFDVMETDQGPPTAADRLYAKPRHAHKKHARTADTQQVDHAAISSMGASGASGTTESGTIDDLSPTPTLSDELRTQPDRELAPDEPRIDK